MTEPASPAGFGAPEWWRNAVVYQVYPRSFADSNGDGIGDLQGIINRLPYLHRLGVDAIWLTPFYPSPLRDGGYDVSDYRNVDPRLGSLGDFIRLVRAAHDLRLRVIIDIVPNHTSDEHAWFTEALAAQPGDPARLRYHFHRGSGPDGTLPPSDWRSHFGGSAWTRLDDGDWYLHLFAPEQPDLNWSNPEIRQDFIETLRFWSDLGVDGFRVDVAHALAKDMSEPLRSQDALDANLPHDGSDPLYDRDELHDVYRTWRKVFDEYDPPRMAVAETWTPTSHRNYLYARPDELGQVFDFALLKSPWSRDAYLKVIRTSLQDHHDHADDGGGLTWVLSSHDVPRHASRLGLSAGADIEAWARSRGAEPTIDVVRGLRRARAATLMMLALPGSAYLYQGEELGLPEVLDLPDDRLKDPVWTRTRGALRGRDGCRVPLPWTRDLPYFGFSTAPPELPQPAYFGPFSVEAQETDPDSTLHLYRQALAIRRTVTTADPNVEWRSTDNPNILHFARSNGWECIVNFGPAAHPIPPGRQLISSQRMDDQPHDLPPDSAVWLY